MNGNISELMRLIRAELAEVQLAGLDVRLDLGLVELMAAKATAEQLRDMVAFVGHGKPSGPVYVLGNLLHDLRGIADRESCFVPRTHGYATLPAA